MFIVVAVMCYEHHHNEECEDKGDADVEFHFYVIEEILHLALDYATVEKDEVKSGKETEQGTDIFYCR